MDNFKIIYKVLKILEESLDNEEFDMENISANRLKVTSQRLNAIIVMLVNDGYIDGVEVRKMLGDAYPQAVVKDIRITLKGLEYLQENGIMQKIYKTAKGITDIIP